MIRAIQNFGRLVVLITLVIVASSFIIYDPPAKKSTTVEMNAKPMIMVGVAYSKKKCGSSSFSEAVGYKYITSCDGGNYSAIKEEIESDLVKRYQVTKTDVIINYATRAFGVIISYYEEISSHCPVMRYTVGFGDTQQEAEDEAVDKKNTYARKSSYRIVKSFNCNN